MNEPWYTSPEILKDGFLERHIKDNREFQGIPTVEVTRGGRIFAAWQICGDREPHIDNCCAVAVSDDNGKSWADPYIIIDHKVRQVRLCNPVFWIDPLNRLWLFWSQSDEGETDKMGVWASICEAPDAPIEELCFGEPHRYTDYIIINKPIVTKDGKWLFTAQDFGNRFTTHTFCSEDNGKSFYALSSAKAGNSGFSETMLLEQENELWQFSRVDGGNSCGMERAVSLDGGKSWTDFKRDIGYPFVGPGARFFIRRLKSGNILLVNDDSLSERTNMTAHISADGGKTWSHLLLDNRSGISYPDGCEDKNGVIRIVYDHGRSEEREIVMAVFTESDVLGGNSPALITVSKV